jgi:hypothetical protein
MAPPTRYMRSDIARALRISRSVKQASELLGMSLGALRKRALNDRLLRPIALACIERGKANSGRPGRSPAV